MIPTIEDIVDSIRSGTISRDQALAWLWQHANKVYPVADDDRLLVASMAMQGLLSTGTFSAITESGAVADLAVAHADALFAALKLPVARTAP